MATPLEDLYAEIQVMMAAVASASPEAITLAPDVYGTEFRIPDGDSMYQIQLSPAGFYHRGTVKFPRADVEILIAHMIVIDADRTAFLHETMNHAIDKFVPRGEWVGRGVTGVFGLDPDDDEPDISAGELQAKVITYTISATVLMDAA